MGTVLDAEQRPVADRARQGPVTIGPCELDLRGAHFAFVLRRLRKGWLRARLQCESRDDIFAFQPQCIHRAQAHEVRPVGNVVELGFVALEYVLRDHLLEVTIQCQLCTI